MTASVPRTVHRSSTFVVASTGITAHTLNASKFVAGLVQAGHSVLWYAEERFAAHVRSCGAKHLPHSAAPRSVEITRANPLVELQRVRRFYRDQVVGRAHDQLGELRRLLAGRVVHAVVSDTLIPAAGVLAAGLGVPWATFGDGPLLWWDEDTPPFGSGLAPLAGPLGRHRNRHVQATIDRWLFGPLFEGFLETRAREGADRPASWRDALMSRELHLQGCTPGFEYPRQDLPDHIRYVGTLGAGRRMGDALPAHLTRSARTRPLAFVTQGTLRPDLRELVIPACRALVDEGFDVLVAGVRDGDWNRWRGRVLGAEWVDYADALGEADLFVTNGGYTGVTLAVAAGVPIVQVGSSEEKPDIGARIRWSGVGTRLGSARGPRWLLRRVIRRVMASPDRRAASARLARESRDYDAEALGAQLLGALATGAEQG